MKPKHTPGPWSVEAQFKTLTNIQQNTETRVPYYEVGSELRILAKVDSGLNDEANARLIAAAPELLEALQKAGEAFDTLSESLQDKHLDLIMLIAETLDKARGE